MPPIVKDTETLKSPAASSAENGTLLQMPAAQRAVAEIGGRVQPVALEVPVTLNGSRTVDGADKREPFSETTKTVLVFGNGAVIRLTSAVAPGQLLFVTNDRTKREVVCQVVKSKSYRNVSGYVELEFTEPALGFWGVRFPSDRLGPVKEVSPVASSSPVSAPPAHDSGISAGDASLDSFPFAPPTVAPKGPKTDKTPTSPAMTQQEASKSLDELLAEFAAKPQAAPPVPSTPELKLETVRLQKQLSSMLFAEEQKTKVSGAPLSPNTPDKSSSTRNASSVDQHMAEKVSNLLQDAPAVSREAKTQNPPQSAANTFSQAQPDEIEIPAWLMPKSNAAQLSNRPQEPVAKVELPAATESPLADSSVEFSSGSSGDKNDSYVPTFGSGLIAGSIENTDSASGSKKGLWVGLAAAFLLLLGGGFWYLQQAGSVAGVMASSAPSIPAKAKSTQTNNFAESTSPTAAPSPASVVISTPGKTDTSASTPSVVPPQNTATAATAGSAANSIRDVQLLAPPTKKPSLGQLHLAAPVVHANDSSQDGGIAAPTFSNSQDLPSAAALGANFSAAGGQPAVPSAPLPIGGNVIPAKLLSSVQPVYSPMAKSQHVSGDVKIDALIDANGHVTTMKIMSGPPLLQQSAMEALRQWKYRPATLNGSPVSMHLTVTLQFRLQ